MDYHRVIGEEIPDHVRIFQMGLGIAFLRMDEHLELDGNELINEQQHRSMDLREMDRGRRRSACCCPPDPKDLNRSESEQFLSTGNRGQPSSVYIFKEKPRGSRTVSAEPFSPAREKQRLFSFVSREQKSHQRWRNASAHAFCCLV